MRKPFIDASYRLGILGGGQLGKMLCQHSSRWNIHTSILDQSPSFPAGAIASEFVTGNFKNSDNVLEFGRSLDCVTIEIESVSSEGLRALKAEGVVVHPDPDALDIIKDKGLQKQFYVDNGLPTSEFALHGSKSEVAAAIESGELSYPFVLKARKDGYDGRGVAVMRNADDLASCFDTASLIEPLLDIHLEIAVIVARNEQGQITEFPAVGMEFHPEANLVEFLYCPVDLDPAMLSRFSEIARATIQQLGISGLLAVEFFVTREGEVLINEVAPRPHNSGHHTIEACSISQFEMHLRGIMNMPLLRPQLLAPAVMVNVLGAPGNEGPPSYHGIQELFQLDQAYMHVYGKTVTKLHRKMGHITIMAPTLETAISNARFIQKKVQVIT